jgi:hypothetical protein
MDKLYQYNSIKKNNSTDTIIYNQENNKYNETTTWVGKIIHYLKSCYYQGEMDKFIKYLNEVLHEVSCT